MQVSRDNERPGARVSVSFSDKDMIANYESASYNVSVTKPIVHRKSAPSANIDGHYALTNFLQNDGPNVDPNLPPNLRPMYTRQKHNARVNLGHQVTPAGSDEQYELATRTRARLWVTQLDELYLGAGAFLSTADGRAGYRVSDAETHGWNLTQTVSKTRSINYATNLPLINLPPDPPLDSCLTSLDAIALQAATSFTVSDATCFANFTFNPAIVISPGTIEEETFVITSVSGNTININGALANTHAVSTAVIAPGSGIGDP